MTNKEKELFFRLCDFRKDEDNSLEKLLQSASAEVLGQLFINRMQGIAFGTLQKNGLLGKVSREFRNSLRDAYEINVIRNRSYMQCVSMLQQILKNHKDKYAMLKGAVLCGLYPEGYRTANDIDLLVSPENITKIGQTLLDAGFRQGHIVDGKFVPAFRKEIVESRMTRGETVPYIIRVDLPYMPFLKVDINFSTDYENGKKDTVNDLLAHKKELDCKGIRIPTLGCHDFFIHLCARLYKEATVKPWIDMCRDMSLYKYADIALFLSGLTCGNVEAIYIRAKELGMQDICSCAILWTEELFPTENRYAIQRAKDCLLGREELLYRVISPADNTEYIFTEKDIRKRFFSKSRKKLLKQVSGNDQTSHEKA